MSNPRKPGSSDEQAFSCFYAHYAPRLWGFILLAALPAYQSRSILVEVMWQAWKHPHRRVIREERVLSWLLTLAYAAGLPKSPASLVFDSVGEASRRIDAVVPGTLA